MRQGVGNMMKRAVWPLAVACFLWLSGPGAAGAAQPQGELDLWQEVPQEEVSDPLEPVNRVFFQFNDLFYTYLLKPTSQGYAYVVPEGGRVAVRNFFHNVTVPVRAVNALLQGKATAAGSEVARFGINTVMGAFGLFDIAEMHFGLRSAEEDFGQTLGHYGVGDQLYLVWPIFGPSTARDTVGMAGDILLSPLSYVPSDFRDRLAVQGGRMVNNTSLVIGEYESIKEAAMDPYLSIRDAYLQNRRKKIAE